MRIKITCKEILSMTYDEIIRCDDLYDYSNTEFHVRDRYGITEDKLKSFSGKKILTRDEVNVLARWEGSYDDINKAYENKVIEISEIAFSTEDEFERIDILRRKVPGIRWEIANAIIHFVYFPYDPDKAHCGYPSLGPNMLIYRQTIDKFDEWMKCVECCRQKAQECNVSMRTLSKALWMSNRERNF